MHNQAFIGLLAFTQQEVDARLKSKGLDFNMLHFILQSLNYPALCIDQHKIKAIISRFNKNRLSSPYRIRPQHKELILPFQICDRIYQIMGKLHKVQGIYIISDVQRLSENSVQITDAKYH